MSSLSRSHRSSEVAPFGVYETAGRNFFFSILLSNITLNPNFARS